MKKLSLLFMLVLALNACDKIDKLTQFDLHLDNTITLPEGLPANIPYKFNDIYISLEDLSIFKDNNTTQELIEEAKLKELKLSITAPPDGNFNFLKDLEIYLSADNLPEIKIAWIYDHPDDNQNILYMNLSDVDLTEYLKKDSIKIGVSALTDEVLKEDYTIKIEYTFFIDAKILGI